MVQKKVNKGNVLQKATRRQSSVNDFVTQLRDAGLTQCKAGSSRPRTARDDEDSFQRACVEPLRRNRVLQYCNLITS